MELSGRAKKVTIFVGQPAGQHGKQPYLRILEWLRSEGAAGATAFKAMAGFGARTQVQTMRLADVVPDLPVMIVWIDTPERVDRLLPQLRTMVAEGLIAIEDTEVALYTAAGVPDLPRAVHVGDVMVRDVVTVRPDTPMSELVADLVERGYRAVPVVDQDRHVVGMVTNGDLVRCGGLPIRLELLQTFDTPELHEELARLAEPHREVAEIMTSPAVTVRAEMDVRHAADLMCRRRLKRLPVVDDAGRLIGIVSRVDLLRTVLGGPLPPASGEHPVLHVEGTAPIRTIMSPRVPTVRADAPLDEVVRAVTSTRLNRAVVVDAERHVLGIVTETELVDRLAPHAGRTLLTALTQRLPFSHVADQEETRPAGGSRARDLMLTEIAVAREDYPIRDVLAVMLRTGRKIVPVVDDGGALVGMVDRSDMLGVLVES